MCVYKRDYFSLQSFDNRLADFFFSFVEDSIYRTICMFIGDQYPK